MADAGSERDVFGAEITREIADEIGAAFRRGDKVDDAPLERRFRDAVAARFPGDVILGEEIRDDTPWHGTGWIIDPIDGTTNFRAGLPMFCVAIARLADHEVEGGWIVDPVAGAAWSARRGHGVERDAPSERPPQPPHRVALFSSRWCKHHPELTARLVREFDLKERTLGSAALEMAHVADRRALVGFWSRARVWDIAAAVLILRESGVTPILVGGAEPSFRGTRDELRERRYTLLAGHGETAVALHDSVRQSMQTGKRP